MNTIDVMKPLILAALMLSGCSKELTKGPDQCLRAEIFRNCLSAVPKGPERIVGSNDWDEVVAACESAAYYQSLRTREQIKPECSL